MPNSFGGSDVTSGDDNPFAAPTAHGGLAAQTNGSRWFIPSQENTAAQNAARASDAATKVEIDQTVANLNAMYRGGPAPTAYSNLKEQVKQRLAEMLAHPDATPADPGAAAPNGDGPSSGQGGPSPNAPGSGPGGGGGYDTFAGPAAPSAPTHLASNDIVNPFAAAQAAEPSAMQLGDPREADRDDRPYLDQKQCDERGGRTVNVPGNEYCVVGSTWYHLALK